MKKFPDLSLLRAKRLPQAERLSQIATLLEKVLPKARTSDVPRADAHPASVPTPSAVKSLPATLHDFLAGTLTPVAQRSRVPSVNVTDRDQAGITLGAAKFISGTYGNAAGRRNFKLFVPGGYRGQAIPLIVMLHGCTQSADDFATGTRMNILAEEQTCLVVYPEQNASANVSKCWNWFNASHQERDRGEPSIIAGITREIMHDYAVDSRRIYVAGLSAGAAQAAIMGATYPDLYAAIGIHSGLRFGAARNLPSAFDAMRNGAAAVVRSGSAASDHVTRMVPAIVFHGDQDTTVHPSNGDGIIAQSMTQTLRINMQRYNKPDGRAYTCTEHIDADGVPVFEHWIVHGSGHAWSGGSSAGSYTDPLGPDATREMLRFFLAHAHPDISEACA